MIGLKIAVAGMKFLYFFIRLFPVRNKVVMISRQSDEPSVDMLLIQKRLEERMPDCRSVILSKKLNGPGYVFHIIRQMYHIATSHTVILDYYCIPICVLNHKKSLTVIQMWHSIGQMKCFGYAMLDMPEGKSHELAEVMRLHRNYDYMLLSSYAYLSDYISGFHARPEQVLQIPLPRADLLSDPAYMARERETFLEENHCDKNKKTILYCPTFRKSAVYDDTGKVNELINGVDFSRYNFVYKPHNVSDLKIDDSRVITVSGSEIGALAAADYVISDYSSIIYEAGICDKTVYLYAYDWEEYRTRRKLYIDLETEVPTIFTGDPEEILSAIREDRFDHDAFRRFTDKYVVMPEPSCTDAIIDLIREF